MFMNLKVQVGDEIKKLTRIRSIGPSRPLWEVLREMGSPKSTLSRNQSSLVAAVAAPWNRAASTRSLYSGCSSVLIALSTEVWKAHSSPRASLCFTISLSWLPSPAPCFRSPLPCPTLAAALSHLQPTIHDWLMSYVHCSFSVSLCWNVNSPRAGSFVCGSPST